MKVDCTVCGGAGYLSTEPSPNYCPYCKGTGRIERPAAPELQKLLRYPAPLPRRRRKGVA